VPDDTFEGGLLESPFKTFQKHFGDMDEPTIYITIEGTTFSIPYDDYMVDDKVERHTSLLPAACKET
jgi:hypothetical protein